MPHPSDYDGRPIRCPTRENPISFGRTGYKQEVRDSEPYVHRILGIQVTFGAGFGTANL